jgi:hypothetical protein
MADFHERELLDLTGGTDVHGVSNLQLNLMAKNVQEAFTIGDDMVMGLPLRDRQFARGDGGLIIVRLTYSGEATEGGENANGNDSGAIGRITYSLQPKFGEEPIETHPALKELMEKYNGSWDGNRVVFKETLPKNTTVKLGRKKDAEERNPMCGVEKWKPVEVTWRRSYAARQIPSDILSRIGKVINNPPGNPPSLPGRTKWLVECPETNDADSGNVVRIDEVYTLLPEDVPEEFYKAYQQ